MSAFLLQTFKEEVQHNPSAIAVRDGDRRFSYERLDRDSDKLALQLQGMGLGKNDIIGLYIGRSYEMVLGLLSILKVGACYLPLDPAYPQTRLRYMLETAKAQSVLTNGAADQDLLDFPGSVLLVDELLAVSAQGAPKEFEAEADDLLYLIFTSGSTGEPKGVAMRRQPLDHLIRWQLKESRVGRGAATLQFAPLSFDVSFQEIFATLLGGGELVIIQDEQRLNGGELLNFIERNTIGRLFLPFVALQFLAEAASSFGRFPKSLREIVTAGEALQINKSLRGFFRGLVDCRLQNQYGPSETHVVTAFTLEGEIETWPALPPIGRPLPHVSTLILDEDGKAVTAGEAGELFLGGECLAQGYLHRPELTAERFIEIEGQRYYKTGDLARLTDNGRDLEFLGRKDGQVKVRGYRIELGEIEVALGNHPAIAQAVVDLRQSSKGDKKLVAWLVGESLGVSELRHYLEQRLPDYMVPSNFVYLEAFPRTPSGKIDRRALPDVSRERPMLANEFREAQSALEERMVAAWQDLLEIAPVGVDDNFFDLGGNSLLALRFVDWLKLEESLVLSPLDIFKHPTIAGLSRVHESRRAARAQLQAILNAEKPSQLHQPIAIIGMAGRFPGAANVGEFWNNLLAGEESIRFFSAEEIAAENGEAMPDDPNYIPAKAVIDRPARFDAAFFGIPPREAELIDPQQRVFLELAWNALEDSGRNPKSIQERVGVFAGVANNSYFPNNVAKRPDLIEKVGAFTAMVGNEKDYVATRVAHKLNLDGPALSVHTACSTSLVAVHLAVQALRAGECELAIAGGASISAPQAQGYWYQEGGMLSADGHCRPFDARASGTIFSDGAGAVVLKPLQRALEDGDYVYAVIEGSALNNDGGDKASFSAPSALGQSAVILLAQKDAGIKAQDIAYVEAHGTATPLGDPIEVSALHEAFQLNGGAEECLLGSVKSNFGHLTGAAGIAGLIKAALAVNKGQVPATLHFKEPNPAIDWDGTSFRVNGQLEGWPRPGKRLAAVSSFGVGGTNAHMIVGQAPERALSSAIRPWQLFVLSHQSESGLDQLEAQLQTAIDTDAPQLADVAFTLNTGRGRFKQLSFVIADSNDSACAALTERKAPFYRRQQRASKAQDLAFLFPGQGAQMLGMGQFLYETERVYRDCVDRCASYLQPLLQRDIRELLFPGLYGLADDAGLLAQTQYTQLSLFVTEYALAVLMMDWGIKPAAMFGHSIGEWVAACLAGCVSEHDALRAVFERGRLMQAQAAGAMLSVQMEAQELQDRLPADLEIAVINGARACVVAGNHDAVEAFARQCDEHNIGHRTLQTSHAFHTRSMEAAAAEFEKRISDIAFKAPEIPFVSCVTGDWISDDQATSPRYWANQIRQTVQCDRALAVLSAKPHLTALELGPRSTLTSLFNQHANRAEGNVAVMTLGVHAEPAKAWPCWLSAMGQLIARGIEPDWQRFYGNEQGKRVPLPGYVFEGQDYWIYPPQHQHVGAQLSAAIPLDATIAPPSTVPPTTAPLSTDPQTEVVNNTSVMGTNAVMSDTRQQIMQAAVRVMEEASGFDLAEVSEHEHFLEVGLDSLLLTQVAASLKREFKVDITFRQLLEDLSSLGQLADFIQSRLSEEQLRAFSPPPSSVAAANPASTSPIESNNNVSPFASTMSGVGAGVDMNVQQLINAQLALMAQQLEILRGGAPATSSAAQQQNPASADIFSSKTIPAQTGTTKPLATNSGEVVEERKAFGAQARIETRAPDGVALEITKKVQSFVDTYVNKTPGSKQFTQENRKHMADPRVVTGFKPLIKEMVYPIVVKGSKGSRLHDIDGNEYVDLINGFGTNFLGHGPDFITKALHEQIDVGLEIGPQTVLAAEVTKLLCDLSGMERAALCNTGSEAVIGALRVARTVTGRTTVVMFDGAYHGINDEEIVRRAKNGRSIPAAAGIPNEAVANIVVLDYGSDEALAYLKQNAHELAAVLVEPVQSRRPDFHPGEFLKELREITAASGSALIFDEVITGFRIRMGGAQEYFGIRADIVTYGKIIGGGMPIGAIAGNAKFMDALDGGYWRFGDDSVPRVGVTYFAGTFVRHPLTLAAAKAALTYIKQQGPTLQAEVNKKAEQLFESVNQYYRQIGFPFKLKNFGSLFKIWFDESEILAGLFFFKLRELGVHVWEGFPCFITVAHSGEDIEKLDAAFKQAADFMLINGFIPTRLDTADIASTDAVVEPVKKSEAATLRAPVRGARFGRNTKGQATWYIEEEGIEDEGRLLEYRDGETQVVDGGFDPFENGEIAQAVESTEAQREIWLAAQMGDDANCAFSESFTLRLKGELNREALIAAAKKMCERHDALRGCFSANGKQLLIHKEVQASVDFVDLSASDSPEQDYESYRREAVSHPFDLFRGPLIRFQLLQLAPQDHAFLVTAHHVICDGWSLYLLAHELDHLYEAEVKGLSFDEPAPSFLEYAQWDRSGEVEKRRRDSIDYWRQKLSRVEAFLELPLDKARPPVKTYRAERLDHQLGQDLVEDIKKVAAKNRATLTTVLMAAYVAFAHRLSKQKDIVIGVPFAGQLAKPEMGLVGHCVNVLPMCFNVDAEASFADLVAQVQQQMREAFDNEYVTYGALLPFLDVKRDPSRPTLLSHLFNVDLDLDTPWCFPDVEVEFRSNPRRFENMDINWNITATKHALNVECTYNVDMWERDSIVQRLEEFESLLRSALAETKTPVAHLQLVSPSQRQMLSRWATGPSLELKTSSLPELLNLHRFGDRPAVCFKDVSLNYRQLDERSNQLARHLQKQGVAAKDLVGVLLDRSADMLIALLAIWRVGAAYVPLDPAYPKDRLLYMAETAQLKTLVTEARWRDLLEGYDCKQVLIDEEQGRIREQAIQPIDVSPAPDDLAYVIFTSGSTGRPKGVQLPHRAVINFLSSMAQMPGLKAEDRLLAVTTLSFDIAVLELYLPLLVGAEVIVASREAALDGKQLAALIEKHQITVMQATPSTWRLLLAAGWTGGSNFKVLCGGEAFPADLAERLLECAGEVWNMYGPTETTVWSTCHRLTKAEGSVPVGRPIANTECYVLDDVLSPTPIGIPGELYIGGAGLARGYLGREDLTAERFIDNHFGAGKLYRTGDQAKWRSDGLLECLGRLDNQVKLRGFRIELGEIETLLSSHPDVAEAVAVIKQFSHTDQRLVAYVRFERRDSVLNNTNMRSYLRQSLPDYMIPQLFVTLEQFPLTQNGKIDRAALPTPMASVSHSAEAVAPRTEEEKSLAAIWSELLQKPQVAINEFFFDIGGHSLLALDMIEQVEDRFGLRISPLDVLTNTLEQLAVKIANHQRQYLSDDSATVSAEAEIVDRQMPSQERIKKQVPQAGAKKLSFMKRLLGKS